MYLFIQYLSSDPILYFFWIVAMLFSSCLHEYVHTVVTTKLHESQALIRGAFSMNPLEIYNKTALICLAIFGIIWGIPPIRTDMLKNYKKGAIISISGSLTNLLLAFFFVFLYFICQRYMIASLPPGFTRMYLKFLGIACQVNCMLIAFNLLPIPGLDAWLFLEAFSAPVRNMDFAKKNIISFTAILLLWATPMSQIFYLIQGFILRIVTLPFDALNV